MNNLCTCDTTGGVATCWIHNQSLHYHGTFVSRDTTQTMLEEERDELMKDLVHDAAVLELNDLNEIAARVLNACECIRILRNERDILKFCDVEHCARNEKNVDCPLGIDCPCKCHKPSFADLSQLEEKIDRIRTRDRNFREDLFNFLEDLAHGWPKVGKMSLSDLRKKYL
jgi:hypothetical protein